MKSLKHDNKWLKISHSLVTMATSCCSSLSYLHKTITIQIFIHDKRGLIIILKRMTNIPLNYVTFIFQLCLLMYMRTDSHKICGT